jgi:hypothetical protein
VLRGKIATLDLLTAISNRLGIPRPVIVLEDREDALLVEGQLAVRKGLRDLKR